LVRSSKVVRVAVLARERTVEAAMGSEIRLGVWKGLALAALSLSGVLLWRTSSVRATQVEAACEDESGAPTHAPGQGGGTAPRGRHRTASVARALAKLEQAGNTYARCQALSRLARIAGDDEGALSRVADYTESSRGTELRVCAVAALGDADGALALTWLLALLDDPAPQVADTAAVALAALDTQAARDALLARAKSGSRAQRIAAACGLAQAGAPEATALIAALLEGSDLNTRHRLLSALGGTGDPGALPLLAAVLETGSRSLHYVVLNAIAQIGGPAAHDMLTTLLHERPALSAMIAGALGSTGDDEARDVLLELAQSEAGGNTAQAALAALTNFDGPEVRALMSRALRGEQAGARSMASDYFASHPDPSSLPMLLELLQQGSPRTMYGALGALAQIDTPEARAQIEQLARGRGPLSEPALGALSRMPEGSELARSIAFDQLARGGQLSQSLELIASDDSPEARAALIALSKRHDSGAAAQAMMYLAQRADPESRRALVEAASDTKAPEKQVAALFALAQTGDESVSTTLRAALATESPMVRGQAVSALAQLGGPAAERVLLDVSRGSDAEVVAASVGALGQLGTPAALARLEELGRVGEPQAARQAVMMLAQTAPERAAPLAEALSTSRDPESRLSALALAGMLPVELGTRIVMAGARDNDPRIVRDALNGMSLVAAEPGETEQALLGIVQNEALPEDLREQARQMMSGRQAPQPSVDRALEQ
jgi:HEAT repeat protein